MKVPTPAELLNSDKAQVLKDSIQFWNPEKTQIWQNQGVDLVIGRREG